MQNAIYNILHEMSGILSISEIQELKRVLIKYLLDDGHIKCVSSNEEYLEMFLQAKRIEGLSEQTIYAYRKAVEDMIEYFPIPIVQLTTLHLREYFSNFKETHNCNKASLDTQRRCLSSFFSWLYEEDFIIRNPIKRIHKIKPEQKVKTVLSDEEIEIIRDSCKSLRDKAIIEVLNASGMRVGELVKLNRQDINFEARECIIIGKGSKERTAYFDAKAKVHLRQYLESRKDNNEALFVAVKKPYNRLQRGSVEKILRDMGKELGINKVHPHKFRRTMATKAIDKGMPVEQLQKILGHKDISTTMTYALVSQQNVKSAFEKFLG